MASNTVDITIRATDQASGVMRKAADATMKLSQASQLAGNILSSLGEMQRAYEQTVAATVGTQAEYANQVRSLNQLNGQSAEANSRLIQVLDDHKISLTDLMSTQREMSKDGKTITLDMLADVASAYGNATSQVDANKIAQDSLGRSWKSYIELLKLGPDAIRAEAAAVSESMILTQQRIEQSREWEMSVDRVDDATQGLLMTLGGGTSIVTQFNNAWAEGIEGWTLFIAGAGRAASEIQKQNEIAEATNNILREQGLILGAGSIATKEQTSAAQELAAAMWEDANATIAVTNAAEESAPSQEDLLVIEQERAKAIQQMTAANQEYLSFVSQVAGIEQSNAQTMEGLTQKRIELQEKYDALFAQGYRSTGEGSQLGGVLDELAKIDAQVAETAATYTEKMNEMIAADVLKGLATGGLTDAETAYYQQIQLQMGLITQQQIDDAAKIKAQVDALLAAAPGAVPGETVAAPGAEGLKPTDIPQSTEDVRTYGMAYDDVTKDILMNSDYLIEKFTEKADSTGQMVEIEGKALIVSQQNWAGEERAVTANLMALNQELATWIKHLGSVPKEVHTKIFADYITTGASSFGADNYSALVIG